MIVFADTVQSGIGHLVFNVAFIKSTLQARSDREALVLAESELARGIKREIEPLQLQFEFFAESRSGGRFTNFVFRELFSVHRVLKAFRLARRKRASLLVFLSLSPFGHIFFRLLHLLYRRQIAWVVYHGELEAIGQTGLRPWQAGFWLPMSLKLKLHPQTRLIVLGESIFRNLQTAKFPFMNQVTWIDHPYLLEPEARHPANREGQRLKIGMIGFAAAHRKNAHVFLQLAYDLKDLVQSDKVQFCVIGKVSRELRPNLHPYIHLANSGHILPREKLIDEIRSLDLIVFPFGPESYRFAASGSFLDAVSHKIPFVALKNDYIEHYAKKCPGLGIICETYEDLTATVRSLVLGLRTWPSVSNEVLDQFRRNFDPKVVSLQLSQPPKTEVGTASR